MPNIRTTKITITIDPDVGLTLDNINVTTVPSTANIGAGALTAKGNGVYELDVDPDVNMNAYVNFSKQDHIFNPARRPLILVIGSYIKLDNDEVFSLSKEPEWDLASTQQKLQYISVSGSSFIFGSINVPKSQIKYLYIDNNDLNINNSITFPDYFLSGFTHDKFDYKLSTGTIQQYPARANDTIGNYFFCSTKIPSSVPS